MMRIMPSGRTITLDDPEIAQLSTWMAAFNRDLPTRVLTAISAGRDMVLVSSPGGVAAELRESVTTRLRAADLVALRLTAPLAAVAALHDALRDALPSSEATGQPLILMIENAEALSAALLARLRALAALRHAGQPVLHVLLIATPSVLPLLHRSGLAALWDDATAHIRLVPGLAACLPAAAGNAAPARPGTWLPPPLLSPQGLAARGRPGSSPITRSGVVVAIGFVALAGYAAAWSLLAPTSSFRPDAAPIVDTEPVVSEAEIWPETARPPASPLALPAALAAAPVSPAAAAAGTMPLHVTVTYSRGDMAAAARARDILARLRKAGFLADGPIAGGRGAGSRVFYGFPQDGLAAAGLARNLRLSAPRQDDTLARPGEISVFVGAGEQTTETRTHPRS